MKRRFDARIWLIGGLLALLLLGCTAEINPSRLLEDGGGREPAAAVPTEAKNVLKPVAQETAGPVPAATAVAGIAPQLKPQTGQLDKESAEAADFARKDLAQKLAVVESAVAVITFEDIVWRDGSLGCPLPDMMYTQGMVDGYVMQLRVGDEIYNYHGAKGRDPFLCDLDAIGRDSAVPSLRSGALATPPGGQ